ncbi:cytochrome c551 [Paenibacillus sp. yr247]|uniref:c-type cytochrome n=1 Tax=Paenibacillus sp. yr247 TaxID=1761880 RepID=UPI0008915133|nr:cytochrome c [Paenibacillus sp. yr247]SDO35213.1 cytochrome c551 [Paenibacillus sp. yr247]
MKKMGFWLIGFYLLLALTGCGTTRPSPATEETTTPSTGGATVPNAGTTTPAAGTVDAQAVFNRNCIACHGTDLAGRMGPNTNLRKIGSIKTKDQIATQIANGGNGMPPFKGTLKPEEITVLTDWLSAKK